MVNMYGRAKRHLRDDKVFNTHPVWSDPELLRTGPIHSGRRVFPCEPRAVQAGQTKGGGTSRAAANTG